MKLRRERGREAGRERGREGGRKGGSEAGLARFRNLNLGTEARSRNWRHDFENRHPENQEARFGY